MQRRDAGARVRGSCEHAFVTAQGQPLTRYRRALERKHIFGAEIAAREMGFIPLRDALGLLALYASEDSPKYDKAATRWLARLALKRDGTSVQQTSFCRRITVRFVSSSHTRRRV